MRGGCEQALVEGYLTEPCALSCDWDRFRQHRLISVGNPVKFNTTFLSSDGLHSSAAEVSMQGPVGIFAKLEESAVLAVQSKDKDAHRCV